MQEHEGIPQNFNERMVHNMNIVICVIAVLGSLTMTAFAFALLLGAVYLVRLPKRKSDTCGSKHH